MLLEGTGRLSILRLGPMLQDPKLGVALHPFAVAQVHTQASKRLVLLTLKLDKGWADRHWRYDFEKITRRDFEGSWNEILIEHPGYRVGLILQIEASHDYEGFHQTVGMFEAEHVVTLKGLVKSAIRATIAVWQGDEEEMATWEATRAAVARD